MSIYSKEFLDPLTGVHCRFFFDEMLERELIRAQRHGRPLAIALFDLDNFAEVNRIYGRGIGDETLRAVCQRVRPIIRKDEVIARLKGDRFAVILPECTEEMSFGFGARLRQLVRDVPFDVGDFAVETTISIGIARNSSERLISPQEFIEAAETKLYLAKRAGGDCVQF